MTTRLPDHTTKRPHPRTLRRTAARRFGWLAAMTLLAAGAGGFWHIVNTLPPIAGPVDGGLSFEAYARAFFASPNVSGVALLLLALLVATLGGAWFVVRLLHWRFQLAHAPLKMWRQSLWVALFVTIGAWLQLNRSLTIALAALVIGGLAALEVFLNVRERQE